MTYLTSHLPFPTESQSLPPAGSHLIISDTLPSPAYFAVYHLVAAALGKEKRRVVWVDFRGEGRASWEAVLKKLGTPLPASTNTSFIHISPSSLPHFVPVSAPTATSKSPRIFSEDGSSNLKAVYESIVGHLNEGSLVLLDGLSELQWAGVSPSEVGRFVRALYAKVRITRSVLVSTLHADHLLSASSSASASSSTSPSSESDLLERLLRIGSSGGVWWRVSHLPSGRSGDVMGEISSHPLSLPPTSSHASIAASDSISSTPSAPTSISISASKDHQGSYTFVSRSNPLQYRLESTTVRVFAKGTGRGFL